MEQIVRSTTASQRANLQLMGGFAALALLLASVGIYGLMAYSVNLRQREFGIRMALGASPAGLLRLVIGQGTRLAGIGWHRTAGEPCPFSGDDQPPLWNAPHGSVDILRRRVADAFNCPFRGGFTRPPCQPGRPHGCFTRGIAGAHQCRSCLIDYLIVFIVRTKS